MARTTRPRGRVTEGAAAATPRRVQGNLPRPGSAASGGGAAPPKQRSGPGLASRATPNFIGDILAELRKVTWPTSTETRHLTIVVGIVSIAIGFFLGGLDLVFGWAIDRLFFN